MHLWLQILENNDELQLDKVFEEIDKQEATECFQRLFCGIMSHPGDFDENVSGPVLNSISLAEKLPLSDKSTEVVSKLMMATQLGIMDETGTTCANAFKGCQYEDIEIFKSIVRAATY